MAENPLPIPNGWFKLLLSSELKVGDVKPVRALGKNFVAFRGESGKAAVLDAYCPHLGAHLGFGGTVVGDTVRCPFHGWQWSTDGRCAKIPYTERIPQGAATKSWPVAERNGKIW